MNESLNENFINEFFKLCFKKKEVIDIGKKYLKYQYLPDASHKEIWKQIQIEYNKNETPPSLGVIYQNLQNGQKEDALLELNQIKDLKEPNENQVIKVLEDFIKDSMCIEFYDNFQEFYSSGKKEQARNYLKETSEKLHNFSLGAEYKFTSIFSGFRDRQYQKKIEKDLQSNEFIFKEAVTGIDELDYYYPNKKGSVICSLAVSGMGKTTQLIYTAIENARRGASVLYVAAEGTQAELEERFDACWTAYDKVKLENSDIKDEEIEKLSKLAEQVYSRGGEVELYLFKQFNKATMEDVYQLVEEFEKKHGKAPDVLILDYLELFTVANKRFSVGEEKQRRQEVARAFSNIITSKDIIAGFTSTQASDVDPTLLNSEEFVLTRHNISADKNLLDSFSLFFSLNQTIEEYNNSIMRLYVDKSRHSSKQNKQIFRIYTSYSTGRFLDKKKTLNEFATDLI